MAKIVAISFNGEDSVSFQDPPSPDRNVSKYMLSPIFIKPPTKVIFLVSFNIDRITLVLLDLESLLKSYASFLMKSSMKV